MPRISSVGNRGFGRMSQKGMSASSIAHDCAIAVASSSWCRRDSAYGGGPRQGNRLLITARQSAYPVSLPWWNGELALIASRSGNQGRRWLLTRTANPRSGRWTCMCSEQTAKSSSIARNCSTPARYRGWSPTAVGPTWVSTGVPDAQIRSPCVAAATEAPCVAARALHAVDQTRRKAAS